jgi:hypothetical protein
MKRAFFVWIAVMMLLVSCSTKAPVRPVPRLPSLPRTSPPDRPHELERILYVHDVGKVEADLMTNELILTTFRKGKGGMRINLFSDYTRVPIQSYIYDVVRVPLDDFKIYVITITADDKVGYATFQLKEGRLYIW